MTERTTTNYKNLVAFSSGQATAAQTLERLGMVSSEDLFLLMAQAYLPMPRVPEVATKAMVQSLHQLEATTPPVKQSAIQTQAKKQSAAA